MKKIKKQKNVEIKNRRKFNDQNLATVTHFPSPILASQTSLNDEEKIEIIATKFREILEVLGLDLDDESLSKTPYRVARMYVKEIFSGLDPLHFPPISFVPNHFDKNKQSNFVLVRSGFTSFCEHHFVPMSGIAHVAYIPKKKIIGLSKIPRIIRFFARRPQLQERLTAQIADSLAILLETENVAVSLSATHHCVRARGIEDESGCTITNVLRGKFKMDESLKQEFFEGVNRGTHQ